MEREAANAMYGRLHKDRPWHDGSFANWAKEPSKQFPFHYASGVTIGVADFDVRPEDKFKTHEIAPVTPETEEVPDGDTT